MHRRQEQKPGPPLSCKPDFERAQRYWDAFWEHEIIDRPCTTIWANGAAAQPEAPHTVAIDAPFAPLFERHDRWLASHHFLGECIPGFRPGFGPDQLAAFLGAPLVMREDSAETSWSQSIVEDWAAFLPLRIDPGCAAWRRMKEFHQRAERHFAGRCLLYNIDLHGNLDALVGLRGAERLLFDLIDSPGTVREALRQATRLAGAAYDEFYRYGGKEEVGTSSWLHFYCRGRYGVVQSDFIALLSPGLFRAFALPAIEEEALRLDRSCFHLDGPGSLVHLDDILAFPRVDAIQWVPGPGLPPQIEWIDLLRKIQNAGKSVIVYGSPAEIMAVHGELRPELLVYEVQTDSEAEGLRLLDWLKAHT